MTGEWEFKLKQMERGQLSRDTFMQEIRGLTREIVDKVKGFGEKPIEGEFDDPGNQLPAMRRRPVQGGLPHVHLRQLRPAGVEEHGRAGIRAR